VNFEVDNCLPTSVVGPAFYLGADRDPGSQTNADPDPDPGQTLKSQIFKDCLFVNFGQFPCS
jgi:hypothetical protein